ncbi:subunit 17 of mediator complex-domain-containing protein [Astrocystis sublimbata]|nr:subunit 17 of mediator complex-domain-containing protein [Astrocystis sublimbata]
MTVNSQSPFSLRPWPIGDKKPKNLTEFITRVNAEPGGFRTLNEADLRREIQERQEKLENGDDDSMDIDAIDDDDDNDDGEDIDDEVEEISGNTSKEAREKIVKDIEFAYQTSMQALDSISLLLSKEAPVQAGTTLSTTLRDIVGIGTLGASKLKEPNVTEDQVRNDLSVAAGWRVVGINNMVDSVLAAAKRLEKEIELETKYWADILDISDNGWTVCSFPQEPYTLGVRFGFSESTNDFRNSSIAPLIRSDDGTTKLGVGRRGAGTQRVRIGVRDKTSGMVTDQSPLPGRMPDDAPLKDRVREARDTIFHQELWHELNLEARELGAYDVYYDEPAVIWKQGQETDFVFTLEDLDEQENVGAKFAEGTRSATAAYSFLQFLLFQSHRQNYYKRTSLSISARQADTNSTNNMLRSFMSRFDYFRNAANFNSHLDKLVQALRYAGMSTAGYSILPPSSPSATGASQVRHAPTTELLWVQQLVSNLATIYKLTLTPSVRIWCRSQGSARPSINTYFTMSLRDPHANNKDQSPSPLEAIFPPAEYYVNVLEAVDYIYRGTIRVLAQHLTETIAERLSDNDVQYMDDIFGIGVASKGRTATIDIEVVDDRVDVVLKANLRGGASRSRIWRWASNGQDTGAESMEGVVLKIMKGEL